MLKHLQSTGAISVFFSASMTFVIKVKLFRRLLLREMCRIQFSQQVGDIILKILSSHMAQLLSLSIRWALAGFQCQILIGVIFSGPNTIMYKLPVYISERFILTDWYCLRFLTVHLISRSYFNRLFCMKSAN